MSKKRKQLILFFSSLIFILALFLRIYRLNQTLGFSYDQGRDAFKVQEIIDGNLTFIGPTTGIPGFFLGPFFYYFILLPYWFSGGNPLVAAIFLILFSILGIFLAAFLVKAVAGWTGFFICAYLLAVNSGHIRFSRMLSNINPILFLSPLYFYFLYLYLRKKLAFPKLPFFIGFLLGLLLQTEFANAIFLVIVSLFILLTFKQKPNFKHWLKMIAGFTLALSLLILFNFKNDFVMLKALKNFFSQTEEKVLFKDVLINRPKFYLRILTFYFSPKSSLFFLFSFISVLFYFLMRRKKEPLVLKILFFWFTIPLLLMLFYLSNKGVIWDYYLVSQFIPFILLFSLFLSRLIKIRKKIFLLLTALILVIFTFFNFKEWQILTSFEANRIALGTEREIIDRIYQKAEGKPFNVDIFVPNLTPVAYQYLFSWYGQDKYGYLPTEDREEKNLFFIIEGEEDMSGVDEYWRDWWYGQRFDWGELKAIERFGAIKLEIRKR